MEQLFEKFVRDVAVELNDEFDQNFERKAFFTDKWPESKMRNNRGSLMARTNNLRNSISYSIQGDHITWSSALPYASIHNEGGEITVTQKMKSFFWAMYYKAAGAVSKSYKKPDGKRIVFISSESKSLMAKQAGGTSDRDKNLNKEAEQWKAMALMKVGDTIKIEKRQFIGDHPQVRQAISNVWDSHTKHLDEFVKQKLKR